MSNTQNFANKNPDKKDPSRRFRAMWVAGASIAASALLLTACGGDASGDGASGGEGDTDSDELVSVTVATNPSSQTAPLFYGIQEGVYEEHGLDVEVVPQTDVAAILSGTASGEYDFGFATVVHVLNANANDIPIRAVATVEGQQKTDEEPEEGNALVAGPDSGVESAADLEGARLAVVGLSSLNTLAAWELADREGVDPESIELVQLPFGQMPAALASGDVDAAVIQSPFIDQALDDGSEVIDKPNVKVFPEMAVGLYTTHESFIDSNEDVVQAFSDATVEAQELTSENVDAARELLVDELGITPEAAEEATWNTDSNPHVNVEGFETAQEMLLKFGEQSEELEVEELVWPGSKE